MEVVPHVGGEVEAAVLEPEVDPTAVALSARVTGVDRQPHDVPLRWNATRGRFVGRAPDSLGLASGPLLVTLEAAGRTEEGRVEEAPALPPSRDGGQVVAVGGGSAEVKVYAGGAIEARLADPSGVPLGGLGGAEVSALVTQPSGASAVPLRWDEARGRAVGQAPEPISTGPLALRVRREDRTDTGRVARLAALTPPRHAGLLLTAGDHSVEIVRSADRTVEAFVRDPNGQPLPGGRIGHLSLRVDDRPLVLRWDDTSGGSRAQADAAVPLSNGPIEVVLAVDGRLRRGRIEGGLPPVEDPEAGGASHTSRSTYPSGATAR